jgi:hypothetical protein
LNLSGQRGAAVTGTINLFLEPMIGQVAGTVDAANHLMLTRSAQNIPEHVV